MYQLSHLLTDQKTVMTSMMELSLTGNKGQRAHAHRHAVVHADTQTHAETLCEQLSNDNYL